MDNNFWFALLVTSGSSLLLVIICLIVTGLAFARQGELGSAAVSGGVGFLALGVAFAIQVGLSYLSLSATVNHQNLREVATLIGMWGFGGKILEVAGLVLVAVAVFQRRPAEH